MPMLSPCSTGYQPVWCFKHQHHSRISQLVHPNFPVLLDASHHSVLQTVRKKETSIRYVCMSLRTLIGFSTSPAQRDWIGIWNGLQTGFKLFFTTCTTTQIQKDFLCWEM